MKILYVYDGDWPRGATRVRKQTVALAEAGCTVRLICRNASRDARVDREAWMEIRRLPEFPGSLNHPLNFPLFVNPVWVHAVRAQIRDFSPDLIIVEDLPLAPTALALGRLAGTPVLYDMGEVYPAFLEGLMAQTRPSLFNRMLRNPRLAGVLERLVLRSSDHVTVVSEESRTRAVGRGADPGRLTIVGNTPEDPESLRVRSEWPEDLAPYRGRPIVLFVGILIHDRGLQTLLRSTPLVLERNPEAVFVIVGDGPERARLEAMATEFGVEDSVHFAGWQEHSTLNRYYRSADVGLLPFLPVGQIHFTLANKLFDYLGAGLPVIATDVPPMRRVVREGDVGFLVEGGDPRSLADAIVQLLALPDDARREMSVRAIRLVDEKYSWRHDAERMVAAARAAAGGGSSR